MKDKLSYLIGEEKQALEAMKEELKKLPKGQLYVRFRSDSPFFTHYVDGHQYGITRNKELVYQLARKAFLKDSIKHKQAILDAIIAASKLSSSWNPTKFNMLNHQKIIYSEKTCQWLENNKSQNPYKPEHLKYVTKNGVVVRSKSERTIGNFLEEHNIPYLYEAPFNLNGKIYYPDFVILKADGTFVLWEHFGLMDDPEYIQKTFNKLEEYRHAGYVQHSNLICTYEEDLHNLDVLEGILHRFIL
jgi:hypothetical protein